MSSSHPAVTISSSGSVPSNAFNVAAAKNDGLRTILAAERYTGSYHSSAGFNFDLVEGFPFGQMLQEIHIDLNIRRPSARLRTAIARLMFPMPVVLHVRNGKVWNLPIIPPEGTTMTEKEYWQLAIKDGVFEGQLVEGFVPGAPPFQLEEIEEEVQKGVWSKFLRSLNVN